jgi:hypothetical protein
MIIDGVVIFIPAFVIGWVVNRRLKSRWLCWAWILPLIWLLYGIWDSYRIYHSNRWYPLNQGTFGHMVWHHFFANEGEGDSPLTFLVFTSPVLSAAAFSVGSWIGLDSRKPDS